MADECETLMEENARLEKRNSELKINMTVFLRYLTTQPKNKRQRKAKEERPRFETPMNISNFLETIVRVEKVKPHQREETTDRVEKELEIKKRRLELEKERLEKEYQILLEIFQGRPCPEQSKEEEKRPGSAKSNHSEKSTKSNKSNKSKTSQKSAKSHKSDKSNKSTHSKKEAIKKG